MTFSDQLSASRTAIVGLGLMGGSLALALKGKCAALYGIDTDFGTLELAARLEIADRLSDDPAALLPKTDLVILAAPVRTILSLLRDLPALHPGPAVVLDVGSTKAEITEMMETLPTRFEVVGGHPMCGKEQASLAHADPGIFSSSVFAFTSLSRTTDRARSIAAQIAGAVGASPLWLDHHTHDKWTASTSHLPYLIASVLAAATPEEASPLVGPGFLSTTRLAASSTPMMLDILLTNRQNILEAARRFRQSFEFLEGLLDAGDEEALSSLLEQGSACRKVMAAGLERRG
jgi:prephenate dehydrogenase